jgi:integrase
VFPSATDGPLDGINVYHRDFLPYLEAAGLRRVTFHALRHTYASLLIQSGASLAYVKEQLGHGSIQVTVDTYGHLIPGANISWIDLLDERVAAKVAETPQASATPAQPEETDTKQIEGELVVSGLRHR